MTDSVNLDIGGCGMTQADINRVTSPFLDLEDALGGIVYFLEGHYDQIILEKVYSILPSALTENQKKIADTQTSVDKTKEAYDLASAAYDVLRDLKPYDIQDLWDAIHEIDQSSACKGVVNETKNEILKLIYDLCKHEINGLNLDSLDMNSNAQFLIFLQLLCNPH
ncbi:MAG: hypothetical protein LBQ23_04055 [Puniceicoccales bacterium]|jgi:hypothetical protein|nr:hypothetical protein [Puniceicoccales bacterium]